MLVSYYRGVKKNRRFYKKRYKIAHIVFSYYFRNRLESNAEHWSALLLSLRELTEWVIRKDTELIALAPPKGDLNALLKQQVTDATTY